MLICVYGLGNPSQVNENMMIDFNFLWRYLSLESYMISFVYWPELTCLGLV